MRVDEGGWPVDELLRLRKNVEICVYLGEASVAQWRLLYVVLESIRELESCATFDNLAAWSSALERAVSVINAHWFRHEMLAGSREEIVAKALRQLRRKGFDARVDGQGTAMAASHFVRLCRRIEKKIERAGGLYVANALLQHMRMGGRIRDGSLIHARTPQMVTTKQAEGGTPWHYVYSLALKHLASQKHGDTDQAIRFVNELSTLLASLLNVEPYSSYENVSIGNYGIERVLRETLIYDEMFAFPQWQPAAAETLVEDWFSALYFEGCEFPVASKEAWCAFASRLLAHAKPDALVPISSAALTTSCLSYSDSQSLISACCTASKQVNAQYETPSHTVERSASYYPVLFGPKNVQFVQPRAIAARALCERLYALMRENEVADLENRMGSALERLTVKILKTAGYMIAVKGGKYPNPRGGNDLEIDIAVETTDRIFLFECKKKPLANASRRGNANAALSDLEKSFLYQLQQLAQHEAVLRSNGCIKFRDGSAIALNGRSVEKFCVSLFDHGSLQHRDMTMALLELLIGRRIKLNDPLLMDLERAINKRLGRIDDSLASIIQSQDRETDDVIHSFAMSTWWMSVDQMQFAIYRGGDLWSGIERIRYLTHRSGDIIYEILATSSLNVVGEEFLKLNKEMDNRSFL